MDRLKERLQRLKKTSAGAEPHAEPQAEPKAVTDTGGSVRGSADCLSEDWHTLGASLHQNSEGSFILREYKVSLEKTHGTYSFGQLQGIAGRLSMISTDPDAEVSLERLLFLDTETTGLGIGAGNVPFMIGIGFYEDACFVAQQLFIRNPGEERAMLAYLLQKLEVHSHLVSYNGRAFDWPIIKNRFVLHRLPLHREPLHLDFLYAARSLWRRTLDSCRLSQIEQHRLGIARKDDVPGSLAPALYFQYLAEQRAVIVEGVFRHNGDDILSLAVLSVHFAKLLEGEVPLQALQAEEQFRLSLWYEKYGLAELAEHAKQLLLQRPERELRPYLQALAQQYKKLKRYDLAVPLWVKAIQGKDHRTAITIEPFIELAMYFEHQEKNAAKALEYAEEALNNMWRKLSLSRLNEAQRQLYDGLQKRVDRLLRKQRTEYAKRIAASSRDCSEDPQDSLFSYNWPQASGHEGP